MHRLVSISRAALLFFLVCISLSIDAQRFQPVISNYLKKEKAQYQLTNTDIMNWTISDQYDNPVTGVTYTYLNQEVSGIRIFNGISTMVIRGGKVAHFSNRFYAEAAKKSNAIDPVLTAEQAIEAAAKHLGLTMNIVPVLEGKEQDRLRYTYTRSDISRENIKAELVLVPQSESLLLAWNVMIAPLASPDWWNIRIDALDGQFIEKNNWTTYCNFDAPHQHSNELGSVSNFVACNMPLITTQSDSGSYNVFPLPVEAPTFGQPNVLKDPHHLDGSPFGWHDINGIEGAEFTITRGNNVYAYDDPQNFDVPGYSPDGGTVLNFNFPFDLYQSTDQNKDAALTNLFYMNNALHDILFIHGFDENAGNFQSNNYTGNGFGNDYVLAEGQDGGGTNNANFGTPEDGFNGRMQMYMWDFDVEASMQIISPISISGYYTAAPSTFGPNLLNPVTGYTAIVKDAVDPSSNGCDSILNPEELVGKIAIIDRGGCIYYDKIHAAELAGAIAVIVVNSNPNAPISMSGSGPSNIPSVMVTKAAGDSINSLLNAGDSVLVTLLLGPSLRDGSLDNGIIAHEYGHGLSNRLTGGPANSNCLHNAEQAGEGWSDWLSLILTIEPGDAGPDKRGVGSYASDEDTGKGLRRYPYSTNMDINPLTYGDVAGNGEVHATGEIWSSALWEMTWNLIDAEGFDPDWYHGTGGNITAMKLVLEGMKLQVCSPGFVDSRDAILAADDLLYQGAHKCLIWESFAKRGMGAKADQGSSDLTGDETEDFSIPNTCLIATVPPQALFAPSDTSNCFGIFAFQDQSSDIPHFYFWDFGDGDTSTVQNPKHTYAIPGQYTVTLIVSNNIGSDTFEMNVAFEDLAPPMIDGNKTVCDGSYTTLKANVGSAYTAIWSTEGSVVHTGKSFQTPSLALPVIYSVKQIEDKPVYNAGPANNTFAGGGNHNSGFEGKLLFETFVPCKLLSVLMYAEGDGDRIIRLYDENNQVVQSAIVALVNGANRVNLNFDISEAGRYSLGNTSENLYRNNAGANYPYEISNVLSIYSSNATNDEFNFYYYFYDWKVQEAVCESAGVDVFVNVEPGPAAQFLAETVDLTTDFTDISSGSPDSWSWNFGDGSPLVNEQNPEHTYAVADYYTIELTVSNGSCFSTYKETMEVGTTASNDPQVQFGMKIYPNPATDEVTLGFMQPISGKMQLSVSNAAGTIMMSRQLEATSSPFSINTSSLSAGTYQFELIGKSGVTVKRVTIVR
jgi:PKD repeat protein